MNFKIQIYIINFLTLLIYSSFVLGFMFNENSIALGGYGSDLKWMWANFEIYKTNDLWTAIHHPDFFGNRTPLLYILHILFNPFINNIDTYRFTVFCISFLGPIIFYLCLKQRFKDVDKFILFFISSFILLSPYYRTSAYWGLEINYGIITMLLSIFFIDYALEKHKNNQPLTLTIITLITFFSSLCLYFDQKLFIIPLIILFQIFRSNIETKFKILTLINYSFFAIPFLYLIFIWQGIAPPLTQSVNSETVLNLTRLKHLHFFHIGYASAIIAFYLLPIILLKKDNLVTIIKKFFRENKNIYQILIVVFYIIFIIFYYDFENLTVTNPRYDYGLGILHKISLIIFKDVFFMEVFTYLSFVISWIIILVAIEKKIINYIIIFYFYFLSVLLLPLMQEYFDPYIILFSFLLFNFKLNLNFKKIISLFLYLLIFLTSTNMYYFIKFS